MSDTQNQIFQLRQQLGLIEMSWLAELSVNAQDLVLEYEIEMQNLQKTINQLTHEKLEPSSNKTV